MSAISPQAASPTNGGRLRALLRLVESLARALVSASAGLGVACVTSHMTGRPNLAYLASIAAVGLVVGLMPRAETARLERNEPDEHGRAMKKAGGSGEGSGDGTENTPPQAPSVQKSTETETAPTLRTLEETPPAGSVREETLPIAGMGERRYVGTFGEARRGEIVDKLARGAEVEGSEETSADPRELLETE